MKFLIKYSVLIFLSLGFANLSAQTTTATPGIDESNPLYKMKSERAANLLRATIKTCEGNEDSTDCRTKTKASDKAEKALQAYIRGVNTNAASEKSLCKQDIDLLREATKEALKACNAVNLNNLVKCNNEHRICEEEQDKEDQAQQSRSSNDRRNRTSRSRSSNRACKSNILRKLSSQDPTYEDLEDDAKAAKSIVERLQENLEQERLNLITLQGRLSDQKLAAEDIVRNSAKRNAEAGQSAVQQALSMQLEVEKIEFEVEDLITLKATELAKAKNAVEDARLDCYEIAVKQYTDAHNACLIRKRKRISEGKYSSNNLRTFFSGSRPGSCKKTNVKEWYTKYQNDCTSSDTQKAKVARLKQQYSETAKNINTTIKRKNDAKLKLQQQLEIFEKNNAQLNKQLLEDQKAALQRATTLVSQTNAEIVEKNKKIFQLEGDLRKEQSIQTDIDRNKATVADSIAKNKSLLPGGTYSKKDYEDLDKYGEAFSAAQSLAGPLDNAYTTCCADGVDNTECKSITDKGTSHGFEKTDSGFQVKGSN